MKNLFLNFDEFFNEFENLFSSNSIRIPGSVKNESGTDELGDWSKQTFSSKDGTFHVVSFSRSSKSNLTKSSVSKLDQLKLELQKLVDNQEFEKACNIRDQIQKLENSSKHIDELKLALDQAIKEQNFEKAIQLRDEIKSLN